MSIIDKICKMLDAGYSREEIAAILQPESGGNGSLANAPSPPDPVPPAPVEDKPNPVVPVPAPDSGRPPAVNSNAEVMRAIQQMGANIVSALQRATIGGMVMPSTPDPAAEIDKITAQIINPTNGGADNGK